MTSTINQEQTNTMDSRNADLMSIVAEIGPTFAARAA